MTRAAQIVYSLALLAGLLAGVLLGSPIGTSNAHFFWDGMMDTSPGELRQFAILQSLHASPDQGKSALLTYVDLLQQLEAVQPERRQSLELVDCYVRLGILEKQSGNDEKAHAWFESARKLEAPAPASKSSDAELENAILKLDQLKQQHGLMY